MKLIFSVAARDDLIRLRVFIADKNPRAARRIGRLLGTSIQKLRTHPRIGRPVEELPECRDLVAGSYVVRYRETQHTVEVIRVWHGMEDR